MQLDRPGIDEEQGRLFQGMQSLDQALVQLSCEKGLLLGPDINGVVNPGTLEMLSPVSHVSSVTTHSFQPTLLHQGRQGSMRCKVTAIPNAG